MKKLQIICLIKSRCGSLKDCLTGDLSNANNEMDEPASLAHRVLLAGPLPLRPDNGLEAGLTTLRSRPA
jgi:hypothetical protein